MRRSSYKKWFVQEERIIKYITLLKSILLGEKIGRTLLILCILVILALLVSPNLIVTPYPTEEEISPRLFRSPYDFSYEDKFITELKQKEVAAKIPPIYDLDLKVIPTILEKIKELLEGIEEIKKDKALNLEEITSKFRGKFPKINISDKNLNAILTYPNIYEVKEDITGLLKTWLTYGITDIPEDRLLTDVKGGIRLRILSPTGKSEKLVETTQNFFFLDKLPQKSPLYPKLLSSFEVQDGIFELAKNYISPNLRFNQKETTKAIKEAIKGIEPVVVNVSKGEKIVGEGEKVDRDAAMKLTELSKHRSMAMTTRTLGFILLIYTLVILAFIYLYKYQSKVLIRNKNLSLIGLIIITAIALAKVISITNIPFHVMPMGAFAVILIVLLNERISMLVTIILSILIGMLIGEKIEFVLLFTSGALAAICTTFQVRLRGDLIKAGIAVGVAQGIIIIGYSLFHQDTFLQIQKNLLWGSLGNGVMTTFIAMGGILYLERIFNITTNFTLFELSDLNAPILKNLLLKAPGTYHHSLLVGNIAESAADTIGANALLVRVGSYYHDIGKMIRPEYFIENQMGPERNPHETLRSTLSVSILRSHIKDGVEVAKRNRLPQSVIEIIQQHHGSSVMAYFYHQAKEKETNNEKGVDFEKSEFSYPGPMPQSKEAAIVMLADSVEATSRTLIKPTPSQIEKLVKKIIDDKFITGELDECDLTLKDLTKIAQSFIKILITLFHARVEYPEKEQEKAVLQNVENINYQSSFEQENQN